MGLMYTCHPEGPKGKLGGDRSEIGRAWEDHREKK